MRNFPTHFWKRFQANRDASALCVVGDNGESATETYWEWTRRVQRIGVAFHDRQLEIGERVALVAPNSRDWLDVAYGAWLAGGTVVPVLSDLERSTALACLGRAGASWIVVQDASAYQRLRGQGTELPDDLNWLLLEWDGETARGDAIPLSTFEEQGRNLVVRGRVDELAEHIYDVDSTAPALVLYDADPGPDPHGAWFDGESLATMLECLGSSLPIAEDALAAVDSDLARPESFLLTAACLVHGRRLAFGASPDNLEQYLDSVQPTHLVCSASYLLAKTREWHREIRDAPEFVGDQDGPPGESTEGEGSFSFGKLLSSIGGQAAERLFYRPLRNAFGGELRSILLLGELLPEDVEDVMHSADTNILDVFGLPECGISHLEQPASQRAGAVGRPVQGYSSRIANPDPDGFGEIEIASDVLFEDYWDGTGPRSVEDGWLQTGEQGRIEDGILYLK